MGAPPVTTIDGQKAFDMTGRSSASFIVDPAFSTWDDQPITITAKVRKMSGSPGFNLDYDGVGPISSLDGSGHKRAGGWNSISGTTWATLTWTIPDASFVGKYGVNIRFQSDSSVYGSYAINEVTITKS